jgi:predicted transcriptional regulator
MSPSPKRSGPPIANAIRLTADGLGVVLGDLEARIMRALWSLNRPVPARTVHEFVARHHRVEVLTVVTVLNKLVAKSLVLRTRRDGLLHYVPLYSREEFMEHASRRVVEGILSLGSAAVSASLVDVLARRDPEQLAELGHLVRRRLREQDEK